MNPLTKLFYKIDKTLVITNYAETNAFVKHYAGTEITREQYSILGDDFHKAVVNDLTENKKAHSPYMPRSKNYPAAQRVVKNALNEFGIK